MHSEQSVEDGLDWIVRHQRADGSWSLNFQDHCRGAGLPGPPAMESDTAATGLALLPLLGAGYIHTVKSHHQEAVRRGLEALVEHQQPDGDLFIGPPGMAYMYSHAIATMAMCEAYGLSGDPHLKKPAQRARRFHHQLTGPSYRGLALLARASRRHLGLRLADLRPAQRPPGRNARPAKALSGCSHVISTWPPRPRRSSTPISPAAISRRS